MKARINYLAGAPVLRMRFSPRGFAVSRIKVRPIPEESGSSITVQGDTHR